ncbi:MAG: glycosyltransferase [Cyanophyceae cyanobacterium]
MRKPVLTIFYQFNPWQSSIGGIQTFICAFLKHAPSEFEVRLVGTGSHPPVGVWQEAEFAGRPLQFMPLIALEDDNVRQVIPTTLRYTAALFGRQLASDFMHFYRIEPTLATLNWSGHKTFFVLNDIQKQMNPSVSKDAILWQRFRAGYFTLEAMLIRQFEQIYSCHKQSAQFYQQRYPEIAEHVVFLPITVEDELFNPLSQPEREQKRQELAQQMTLPEATRFILFAGRLHPQKDPLLLVRAFAKLREPDVHLLIAGEGELADEIRAEVDRCGLTKHVTMLGPVRQERLAELYRLSSLFVVTSAYEGGPIVALEALACGTPVVTTDCGETPSFLTPDSGHVCDSTPEAIAAALAQVLQHPQNYPPSACNRTIQPYRAQTVIRGVYAEMLRQWERCSHSLSSEYV